MNNADKPAYPQQGHNYDCPDGGWYHVEHQEGLTKRERFAMAAMQGMLASNGGYGDKESLSKYAVKQADELLKLLEQTNE